MTSDVHSTYVNNYCLSTEQHIRESDAHTLRGEARPFLNDGCTREPLRGRTLADIAVREKRGGRKQGEGFPGRTASEGQYHEEGDGRKGDRMPPILAL